MTTAVRMVTQQIDVGRDQGIGTRDAGINHQLTATYVEHLAIAGMNAHSTRQEAAQGLYKNCLVMDHEYQPRL